MDISPFRYEELRLYTRIHRNALRDRLESLIFNRVVLKQKYSIPNDPNFVNIDRSNDLFDLANPKYHQNYYLLNYSNPKTSQLISYYYREYQNNIQPSALTPVKKTRQKDLSPENRSEIRRLKHQTDRAIEELVKIEKEEEGWKKRAHEIGKSLAYAINGIRSLGIYDSPLNSSPEYGTPMDSIADVIAARLLKHGVDSLDIGYFLSDLPKEYKLPDFDFSRHSAWIESLDSAQLKVAYRRQKKYLIILSKIEERRCLSKVNEGKGYNRELDNQERKELTECFESLKNQGYSNLDAMIRCAIHPTKFIHVNYGVLWNHFNNLNFLN